MVRFKNRWLLVEFIFPDDQAANLSRERRSVNAQAGPGPSTELHRKQQSASTSGLAQNGNGNDDDEDGDDTASKLKKRAYEDAFGDDDDDDRNEDPSDLPLSFYPPLSSAPHFLVPAQPTLLHPPTPGAGSGGDASRNVTRTTTTTTTVTPGFRINEKQIWQALKECVIEVNGDGGWGKVGSSLGVKYYSPTTSLCILRVARDHYRLVWSALTFLSRIRTSSSSSSERVIARVVCCSGTVKKLQLQAIRYSRKVVAGYLAQGVRMHEAESARQAEIKAWNQRKIMIEGDLAKLQDSEM